VSCPVPPLDCPRVVAGNYNITIGDCVSGNAAAAASDGLSTDAIGCTPVSVRADYADRLS